MNKQVRGTRMTVSAIETCDLCDCGMRLVQIDDEEFLLSEEEWQDFIQNLLIAA
jgi:hypothetical protein